MADVAYRLHNIIDFRYNKHKNKIYANFQTYRRTDIHRSWMDKLSISPRFIKKVEVKRSKILQKTKSNKTTMLKKILHK